MLGHYIKTFFRNFRNNKIYSITGFISLTLGLTFCLVTYLYLENAFKVPDFHTHFENFYTLKAETQEKNPVSKFSPELIPYLKNTIPEAEEVATYETNRIFLKINDKVFLERAVFTAPSFFDVFSYSLKLGNARSTLDAGNQVMVTPKIARKFFGQTKVMGESITVQLGNSVKDFTITGILEPYPYNSIIQPDIVLPIEFLDRHYNCSTSRDDYRCKRDVIVLSSRTTPSHLLSSIEQKIPGINSVLGRYENDALQSVSLAPLFERKSYNLPIIYAIVLFVLIVLALSCINYINNTIAVTSTRVKEIGIRKVFGIRNRGIMAQFFVETLLTVVLAITMSILILELTHPFINYFLSDLAAQDFQFTLDPLFSPSAIVFLVVLLGVTVFIAGLYPSLTVSRFDPSLILKNRSKTGRSSTFSKVLVGVQLAVSMILMVLILNIYQTISETSRETYGVEVEHAWMLDMNRPVPDYPDSSQIMYPRFRSIATLNVNTKEVGGLVGSILNPPPATIKSRETEYRTRLYRVDPYFFSSMGMRFYAGGNSEHFNRPVQRDSTYAVINKVLADQMSLLDPVGELISMNGRDLQIVGAVDNFTGLDSQKSRTPIVFLLTPPDRIDEAIVNLGRFDNPERMLNEEVKKWWEKAIGADQIYFPVGIPDPMRDFQLILKAGGFITAFVLLFTFIGLFSLTNFSVSRRLKEISIRKVNGAMPVQIVRLLLNDYINIGFIALIVALPLGFIASNKILNVYLDKGGNFMLLFMVSLVSLMTFILLSVAYQVYKASNVNPVKYLKDE